MTRPDSSSTGYSAADSLKPAPRGWMRWIGFVDRGLNRPVAALIVRAVYATRVSPNHLSYLSGLLGLLAAGCFWVGGYPVAVAGAVLAQASSVVDGADGMLARARKSGSPYGAYLDLLLDRIVDFFILAGIAMGLWADTGRITLLILGLFTAGLYLLQIHLFYLTKGARGEQATGDTGEARAILYWALLAFAVAGRMDLFVYVMLTETVIVNIVRFVYFVRLEDHLTSRL